MRTFVDKQNRTWRLELDAGTIKRVRTETGFDLAKMYTPERLGELAEDVVLLVDVLASLVAPQITAAGISGPEFAQGITGDVFDQAVAALLDAGADFLPSTRAEPLRKMTAKAREVETRAVQMVSERIDSLTVEDLLGRLPNNFGASSTGPRDL